MSAAKFTVGFCTWRNGACFCGTAGGFSPCNEIISTVKNISTQVLYNFPREFAGVGMHLINALPSPQLLCRGTWPRPKRAFTHLQSSSRGLMGGEGIGGTHTFLSLGECGSVHEVWHTERRYCRLLVCPPTALITRFRDSCMTLPDKRETNEPPSKLLRN